MLGEHDRAEGYYRQALGIEEGGPGRVHGYYAWFLFERGREAEALDLITQARRLDPDDPEVFSTIGEALAEHGHAKQAVRWFTAGIVRWRDDSLTSLSLDELHDDVELLVLAQGRQAARERGLAPDHLDELVAEFRASAHRPCTDIEGGFPLLPEGSLLLCGGGD